jgi:hypothetical protein
VSSKLPHHYAAAYLQARSKDAQAAALKGCPTEWQELVKTHIRIKRERGAYEDAKKNNQQARRNTTSLPVGLSANRQGSKRR